MENEKCRVCGKEITNHRWCVPICSDECFTKDFWDQKLERYKKGDKNIVVCVHHVYYIAEENASGDRGFDGAVRYIKFFDGRLVRTTNLWYNGKMPEEYYDKMPDNATWSNWKEWESKQHEKE